MENTENLKQTCQFFLDKGCSFNEAMDVITRCPDLLTMAREQLERKVTLMFNADVFYGIILCEGNSYREYLSPEVLDNSNQNDKHYVVKILLDTLEKEYLKKIMGIEPEDTLEEKLYKMKQSSFNHTGYKVK